MPLRIPQLLAGYDGSISIYTTSDLYSSVVSLVGGSVIVHWSLACVALGVLLLLGALACMVCEEQLVKQSYPEYLEYSKVTKRMIPYAP
jgi:protein-S-isoprenylcysteine O-methyltransferase Ste14